MIRFLSLLLLVGLVACAGEGDGAEDAPRPGSVEIVTGATPDAALDALVDFGNVTIGARRSRTVVVRNPGELPVTLEVLRPGEPFSTGASSSLTLGPGEEGQIVFDVLLHGTGLVEATTRIGWRGGALDLRLRASGATCDLVVMEQALDFGVVQLGGRVVRDLVLVNDGEGACTVEAIEVAGVQFRAAKRARTLLLPGTRLALDVEFVAMQVGEASGTLRFTLAGEPHETFEVPLSGTAIERCVRADPPYLHFEVPRACSGASVLESVWIYNDCEDALTWSDHSIETDGDPVVRFGLNDAPAPGTKIAPGTRRRLYVRLDAGLTEAIDGRLNVAFEDGVQLEVALAATPSDVLPVATYEAVIDPTVPVDVLVVIDDTELMVPWAADVDAFAASLATRLYGHDFQLGVTTVSRSTVEGCSPAPDGRLLPLDGSEPRVLDRDTPDLVDTLAARLQVGTCQSSATASGLATALRAVRELATLADDPAHPEPDDGNLGFVRPDSHLLLLFLVAGEDRSSDLVMQYASWFRALRPSTSAGISVQTWYEMPGAMCDGGWSPSYLDFTGRMGGALHSLCLSPWPSPWPLPFAPAPSTYSLEVAPGDADGDGVVDERDLQVAIDGAEVAPYAVDGTQVWTYYSDQSAVRFYDGHRPRGGERLTITYTQSCF